MFTSNVVGTDPEAQPIGVEGQLTSNRLPHR